MAMASIDSSLHWPRSMRGSMASMRRTQHQSHALAAGVLAIVQIASMELGSSAMALN